MDELGPGQRLDQYDLVDTICNGGMATVFRARDTQDGRWVALKVPLLQFESDIVFHQRFLREEKIGLRLNHPGIIRVLRPREKSRVYMAMEYLEGELLSTWVQREKGLPVETALGLANQITDVLVYLHAENVIHRDLKPENIMVLPDGKMKLMDFGIALDTTQRKITWSGLRAMGTPDYMAPEQLKGRRGDFRTDIYSFGVILYEMLTGALPFPGENVYAVIRAKVQDGPIPPRVVRGDLSPQIEEIILRSIERDPADRFQDASKLREALAHPETLILTDRSRRQRLPPTLLSRLSRFLARIREFTLKGAGLLTNRR